MDIKNEAQFSQQVEASHQQKLDKIEKAYSSEPWWYDVRGFFILTFAYRSTIQKQIQLFSNNMKAKHLEVAVGTGTLLSLILKWRSLIRAPKVEITAFDYAPRMLAGAIRRFRGNKQMHLELGDVTKLHYSNHSFDSANIANAIHCFPDVKEGLAEVHRVLKTGGTLAGNVLLYPRGRGLLDKLATKINLWGIKKGILYTPYRQQDIEELLYQVGFETLKTEVSGNCFNFVAVKK